VVSERPHMPQHQRPRRRVRIEPGPLLPIQGGPDELPRRPGIEPLSSRDSAPGRSEAGSDDDWPTLSVSFRSLSRSPRQKDGGRSSAEPYYLSNYREAAGRKGVRKKVGCLGKRSDASRTGMDGYSSIERPRATQPARRPRPLYTFAMHPVRLGLPPIGVCADRRAGISAI
jgi:hypothetical protein